MKNPCKDCAERHVGCHGTCESYKDWKAENDAKKAEQQKKRIEEYAFNSYRVGVRMHAKKRARMQNDKVKEW